MDKARCYGELEGRGRVRGEVQGRFGSGYLKAVLKKIRAVSQPPYTSKEERARWASVGECLGRCFCIFSLQLPRTGREETLAPPPGPISSRVLAALSLHLSSATSALSHCCRGFYLEHVSITLVIAPFLSPLKSSKRSSFHYI